MFNFILPQFIVQIEKWKWNKEYRVYVSNLGNFKNEHKQLLPVKINAKGYCLVKTECDFKLAHRVVMLTWCPIPNAEELTVDHLNHNKRDNSVKNLEWVTYEENKDRADRDLVLGAAGNLPNGKKHIIIRGGQKEFNSYEEAAKWLIQMQNMSGTTETRIVTKIQNAVKNNTMYCGRKWKEIRK